MKVNKCQLSKFYLETYLLSKDLGGFTTRPARVTVGLTSLGDNGSLKRQYTSRILLKLL